MKFVRNILAIICLLAIAIIPSKFCFKSPYVFASSEAKNVVIVFEKEQSGKDLTITAKLIENSGISAIALSLNYDKNCFEYVSYSKVGCSGLSSLSLTSTGASETNDIKFLWEGEGIDTSLGQILKLNFKIKDNISDGNYEISLTYKKYHDVCKISGGDAIYVNPIIDKAEVVIKNNEIDEIKIYENNFDEENSLGVVIYIVIGVVIVLLIVVVLLIKKRKNKKWVKV